MAAMFSGASRATLTSIIILFEMTLDYHIIIPLMFACVISDALSHTLMKDSIYTRKIRRKGLAIDLDMEIDLMYTHKVEEIMTTQVTTLPGDLCLKDAFDKSKKSNYHRFCVVDENNSFLGILTYREIENALKEFGEEVQLKDLKALRKEFVYENAFIKAACNKLSETNLKMIPVVEPKTLKIKGVVSRSDFFKINLLKES
jgi:CIC family chloride channel protein